MKRLWITGVILLAILAGMLGNSWYMSRMMGRYESQLTTAQELAAQGAWSNAAYLTQRVFQDWERHDFYLHTTMRHTDIDAVLLTFREVEQYLRLRETDQYTAANARLITQLKLLAEMEQLTLKNIL